MLPFNWPMDMCSGRLSWACDGLKGVGSMKFDMRILTGLLIGMVLGLHYHEVLAMYLPLLVIAGLVMLLKVLHR